MQVGLDSLVLSKSNYFRTLRIIITPLTFSFDHLKLIELNLGNLLYAQLVISAQTN